MLPWDKEEHFGQVDGKEGIMGGDNIPRRPPIRSCSCGCRRFRKVNPDGSSAIVKIKLLKNVRKAAARTISWTSRPTLYGYKSVENKVDFNENLKEY